MGLGPSLDSKATAIMPRQAVEQLHRLHRLFLTNHRAMRALDDALRDGAIGTCSRQQNHVFALTGQRVSVAERVSGHDP
jgi:hypothetical protein